MKNTYIIAVSGGVDSVVLLHKLISVKPPSVEYVVAHFDHGIRENSAKDAEFVKQLAEKYNVPFISKRVEMGLGASEDAARVLRYEFLFECVAKHKAEGLITAHHQDDVLETMILNILRGSGPRGLIGYSRSGIIRPFIRKTKQELSQYAQDHKLSWREDETNNDVRYLRNNIRQNIMPKISKSDRNKLLDIRERMIEIYSEIDNLAKKTLVQTMKKKELVKARFVVLPLVVQKEVVYLWLRLSNVAVDRTMIDRLVLAIKTMQPNKKVDVVGGAVMYIKEKTIVLNI